MKDETTHESEIDLSVEPLTSCDQATDEHDVISSTRKRRRLTHKPLVSERFSDDFDEDDVIEVQADCPVPAFAENLDWKRTVVGTIGATGFEGDSLPTAMETSCQSVRPSLGDTSTLSSSSRREMTPASCPLCSKTDGTKTESRQQRKLLEKSTVAEVQRNSSSLGKGQRRNLSSMTKVLSTIFAAAQFLDSSCSDCWNRAVRFGRPDLLEVCANSDSLLVKAVESAGREGLRTSFWNGYDLTTWRGRERLQRKDQDTFGSPCRVSGASSQRVSRILDGIAAVVPRVQTLACHVHFAQPLSVSSWRQNSLLGMSEKMMKAVVNGCAWGLRHSRGSLLNRSWQVLTTSPDVQRVLNHRICDKKHKHGRVSDLSSESSSQFPQSLCQTLANQFLVKDSWHSVLGILEHLHLDEDE